mmetsp:Transcript_3057/g.8616  ORF Transcript_3057/g.8616 Transcript_3057/m.8616 type:complete len:412 (-) Transcript_3057:345-1580(-)
MASGAVAALDRLAEAVLPLLGQGVARALPVAPLEFAPELHLHRERRPRRQQPVEALDEGLPAAVGEGARRDAQLAAVRAEAGERTRGAVGRGDDVERLFDDDSVRRRPAGRLDALESEEGVWREDGVDARLDHDAAVQPVLVFGRRVEADDRRVLRLEGDIAGRVPVVDSVAAAREGARAGAEVCGDKRRGADAAEAGRVWHRQPLPGRVAVCERVEAAQIGEGGRKVGIARIALSQRLRDDGVAQREGGAGVPPVPLAQPPRQRPPLARETRVRLRLVPRRAQRHQRRDVAPLELREPLGERLMLRHPRRVPRDSADPRGAGLLQVLRVELGPLGPPRASVVGRREQLGEGDEVAGASGRRSRLYHGLERGEGRRLRRRKAKEHLAEARDHLFSAAAVGRGGSGSSGGSV